MKKTITATLILLSAFQVKALDLTPHQIVAAADAPSVKRYFFQDADKRMTFKIDNRTMVNGSPDSAAFSFSDITGMSMKLVRSALNPQISFDGKGLESYRTAANAFLPSHAENVKLDETKANAIAINGWTSYEFVFTYNLSGMPYRRSITFLNYSEKEQLVLDISAPAADYTKTYFRGYRILNSLTDFVGDGGTGPT